MKIFDCFTFFNELDVLAIRLEYLYPKVDHFVLVESDHTHTGKPKPYNFDLNKERFSKYLDKIIHVKYEYVHIPENSSGYADNYNPKDEFWKLENEQRNAISLGLVNAQASDIILISDLDEIPSYDALSKLKFRLLFNSSITFIQKLHLYYLNCEAVGNESFWKGTVATKFKNIKSIQELRNNRNSYKTIINGGWHLSYMGGIDSIITKIESFAHTEFNREEIKNKTKIIESIKSGRDIYGRQNSQTQILDFEKINFPFAFKSILAKYPSLIFNDPKYISNDFK